MEFIKLNTQRQIAEIISSTNRMKRVLWLPGSLAVESKQPVPPTTAARLNTQRSPYVMPVHSFIHWLRLEGQTTVQNYYNAFSKVKSLKLKLGIKLCRHVAYFGHITLDKHVLRNKFTSDL